MIQEQIKQLEERFLKELAELKAKAKEEKPEFKPGDWVVCSDEYWNRIMRNNFGAGPIYRCKKTLQGDNTMYLYTQEGDISNSCCEVEYFRLATASEIENHLIEEARKKGFVAGARFNSALEGGGKDISVNKTLSYQAKYKSISGASYKDVLWNGDCKRYTGYGFIYCNGQWAELLPSTPSIEINGYKAEFKEWGLDFNNGCAKIDKTIFIGLSKLIKEADYSLGNKSIEKVTIGKVEFTTEQIKSIASHYTK